jgi:hypothetical protein
VADKPKRTDTGQLVPGQGSLNPGGRAKVIREALDEFRNTEDLKRLRLRLMELAEGEDGKIAVSAIREYHDRAYGKAPIAITGEDGGPVKVDTDLAGMINRLAGKPT